MTLHTLNKADTTSAAARACLACLQPDDTLLLIEDGVYALLARQPDANGLPALAGRCAAVLALREDLAARGISDKIPADVGTVDYPGFVALCLAHDRVINW